MTTVASQSIYAIDVGSTIAAKRKDGRARFAWARIAPDGAIEGNYSIDVLVRELKNELEQSAKIALGIESPLFIPIPKKSERLSKGRQNERNRSFAAPVGLAVTTLGLHQLAWILKKIFAAKYANRLFMDLDSWRAADGPALLCWEAFVSGGAHGYNHVDDAATAVQAFKNEIWKDPAYKHVRVKSDPESPECGALSIIGTAALWSGWTTDVALLHSECLVVKPEPAEKMTARIILPT